VAIPLFWVVPLAFYLLSFVICFDSPRRYRRAPYLALFVVAVGAVCRLEATVDTPILRQFPVFLGLVLAGCLVCHGEAYRLRPHSRFVTGFYLALASGGALGGAFVAVVAPLTFTGGDRRSAHGAPPHRAALDRRPLQRVRDPEVVGRGDLLGKLCTSAP